MNSSNLEEATEFGRNFQNSNTLPLVIIMWHLKQELKLQSVLICNITVSTCFIFFAMLEKSNTLYMGVGYRGG